MAFNIERVGEFFEKEILRHVTGSELAVSVVLDSSNLPAYCTRPDGRIVAVAGTVLTGVGSDTDEVQTITITGSPTGGTFKLKFNDQVTAALPYNISGANLETALDNLDGLEDTDVEVTGDGPYTLTFGNRFSGKDVNPIEVADNSLTGGTDPQIEIVETTKGKAKKVVPAAVSGVAAADVVGILAYTVEFFDTGSDKTDEPAAAFIHNCIFDKQKLIAFSGNEANVKTALATCKFL